MTKGTNSSGPSARLQVHPSRWWRILALPADQRGAVLVEAAFVMPMIIAMLLGVVTYGLWFAEAHNLQQIANDAARSTLGTMNATERQAQVDKTIATDFQGSGLVKRAHVTVTTALDGDYYTVTLSYDISSDHLFSTSLVPLPQKTIVRSATVELSDS